jgi:hypothetical protein
MAISDKMVLRTMNVLSCYAKNYHHRTAFGNTIMNADVEAILADLETDRTTGRLVESIAQQSWVRYGMAGDESERIIAVDGLGRCWDFALEAEIRKRIDETPIPRTIRLSEQPEYQNQSESIAGIFEALKRDGTLWQHSQDCFYKSNE